MEYKNLNAVDDDGETEEVQMGFKRYWSKKKLVIATISLLTILLLLSTILIVYLLTNDAKDNSSTPPPRVMDERIPFQPSVKQNGSTIECQREFFLFHQDQNHVCEVTGLVIKNDTTNITIIGNSITNVLYIFNFEVYKLPKEIFVKFTNLKHLIVNGNHLQILEKDTFDKDAENLEVLRLSNNDLKEIKALIFHKMKNLKTLDLGRNKIARIESEAFTGLVSLERLYLSDNYLRSIPTDLFYPLTKLISLNLENNQISSLDDDAFKNNRLMRSIGLSNNTFKDLQNELFHYFENLTDLSISELRINSLDLNGTSISTLVLRNTDLVQILLSNFPKILVSYGTNIECMKFIITKANADFTKIPNWGGMYYNKNIRFIFFLQKEIATQDNIEAFDMNIRKHSFLSDLNYSTLDGLKFLAVEYVVRTE